MRVNGVHYHSIWLDRDSGDVWIIDQRKLPHYFETVKLRDLDDACHAITAMQVRGAPLIGAMAAFGVYLALRREPGALEYALHRLSATRPTAVNLRWALERVAGAVTASGRPPAEAALEEAQHICAEDIDVCSRIGEQGLGLIQALSREKGDTLNILTHCNAGWLATVDWGTAMAPIYKAHQADIPLHIWVDETRPRNQGASLTAWELAMQGVSHTVISDNAGGHLMQEAMVDLCLVGSDCTTVRGDVCNKIGTYLKALAAHDNGVPFYVALPCSTIDWAGSQVVIEERDSEEVTHAVGLNSKGVLDKVRLTPADSPARNYAFDITPSRLVSGLVTECGIIEASERGLEALKRKLENV